MRVYSSPQSTRRLTKQTLFAEQEIVYSADTFNNQSDDEDWD